MPQMAPLAWAPLMLFSLLLISIFATNIFWIASADKEEQKHTLPKKNISWKW